MKRTYFQILAILLLSSFTSFSQVENDTICKDPKLLKKGLCFLNYEQSKWTAGQHLIQAGRLKTQGFFVGTSFLLVGGGIAYFNNRSSYTNPQYSFLGGGIALFGSIISAGFYLSANNHLKKAGQKLDNKAELKFYGNSFGLSYSF